MQQQTTPIPKKILITGGSGYIGQITTMHLINKGFDVWILDPRQPAFCPSGQHFPISTLSSELPAVMARHQFDCVIHLGAFISVSESVDKPDAYFHNNVIGTQRLLQAMQGRCDKIIFSSSAAVYGELRHAADETAPTAPTSPYGAGKLQSEKDILQSNLNACILRLFNVSGAVPLETADGGYLGEEHLPETHLIPLVIQRHLQQQSVFIFGDQYDTVDGTCVREYVHVLDVATAIERSLHYLSQTGSSTEIFNVSSAKPQSVSQVIQAINHTRPAASKPISAIISAARAGDPAQITANIQKIQEQLNWTPQHSSIHHITETSWAHQTALLSRLRPPKS